MACDLQNGRATAQDCKSESAGVRTVFFMRHSQLTYTKNLAGEIDTLGPATVFRFEQDHFHGLALQEVIRGEDMSQFVRQQIDLTIFYLDPAFLQTVQHLKLGNWAVFFMDYDNKIRLLGDATPMQQIAMVDQSGTTADGNLWSNLSHQGIASNFAPFLEDFTKYPFDNFPGIVVVPKYTAVPGLLTYNNVGEYYKINTAGNRLDHNG